MLRPAVTRIAAIALCLLSLSEARADEVPLDLGGYKGRVLYLDFLASWCGPCRQSFPWMQTMQEIYKAQGLEVVAVDVDKSRRDADRFLAAFHHTFQVYFDPNGELAQRFNVHGMPTGMLIDRRGMVRFTHIGFLPVDAAAYENELKQLLNEK